MIRYSKRMYWERDFTNFIYKRKPTQRIFSLMKKYLIFFAGLVVGAVLTFGILMLVGKKKQNDGMKMFETPVSYEQKVMSEFKVFQVLGNAALTKEVDYETEESMARKRESEAEGIESDGAVMAAISCTLASGDLDGKVVLLLGEGFYNEQRIKIDHPKQYGTYSYPNNMGMMNTVPIVGE